MEKLKTLIVDNDVSLCNDLAEQFSKHLSFEVAKPIYDGAKALDYIKSNKPNIIILDLILSIYDGLYIINYIHRSIPNYNPFIYVISVLGIEKTNKLMINLNVDYYSVKPVSPHVIVDNVIGLFNKESLLCSANISESEEDHPYINIEHHVETYLTQLGAPLYRLSTRCTSRLIQTVLDNVESLSNMNNLYTEVGQTFIPPLKWSAVERNIRSTIKYIATSSNTYFIECFGNHQNKITASAFLSKSVQIIRKKMEGFLIDKDYLK